MKKKADLALAVLFCAAILLVGCMTLVKSGRNFAYGFFKSYTDQLPKEPDVFDNVSARIYKLNYNAENRLWGRTALRHISARAQMLPGKELINIAGYDMVKLTSGGYYNVVSEPYDPEYAQEFVEFAKRMKAERDIGTVFVYCHTALYEDGLLPGDVDTYDSNNDYADRLVNEFRSNGIAVVDSRDSYRVSGLTIDEAVNKSDVHWSHRLALYTAHDALKALRELGYDTDESRLDIANFSWDPYPGRLSGEFAKRVGDSLVAPDDVYVLYPSYETHILYEVAGDPDKTKEGTFREAAINYNNLILDPGKSYSSNAYYIYGHYLEQTHTVNETADNDLKILIFKDSFGAPLSILMGLGAKEVYAVDTRNSNKTIQDWVDEIQPDVVMLAYCEQTFRKIETVIAD